MSNVSYFGNANNVIAKKMTFNNYLSDGDALQFLYNHSAAGAMHDSDERFPPPMCHRGTRQAVVARITAWYGYLTRPKKRMMWVHAPAGYGKTAIAGTVSKILEETEGLDFYPLGATFFFWRTSPERNSPARFIITLAYQLAMSIPELKLHIENAVKQNPMILKKTPEVQLVKLILEPFKALGQDIDGLANRLVVIDGLDECINSDQESRVEKRYAEDQEKAQSRVLDLIHTLQSHQLPLSFLILSRPEPWIKQRIQSTPFKDSVEILDLYEVGDHMNDVEIYIRTELLRIAATAEYQLDNGDGMWPEEALVQKFVNRTRGHMLYASTVIRHIDDPYDDPRSRLNKILNFTSSDSDLAHSTPFSSLYQLYKQIMRACPENIHPVMIEVLGDLVATRSLLPKDTSIPRILGMLDRLAAREPGRGIRAVRGLHAVLRIQANPLAREELFIHSSFVEFLSNPRLSLEFTVDETKAARRLLLGCLNFMSAITLDDKLDEDHLVFSLTQWAWLWLLSWGREFDRAPYLSAVEKLLSIDFTSCFVKAFCFRQDSSPIIPFLLPAAFYERPGPNHFIISSTGFHSLYSTEPSQQVKKAVLHLHSSVEKAFIYLLDRAHIDGTFARGGRFVAELFAFLGMLEKRLNAKDLGGNKVVQALKNLWREHQAHFDSLVEDIGMVTDDRSYRLKVQKIIDFIREDSLS